MSPHCDLDIEDSEPIFLHDTPPHGNTPQNQVWLKTVRQFRRYCLDKLEHTDRRIDGQSDSNIREGITKIATNHNTPIYL